jgi:hypothetical protein
VFPGASGVAVLEHLERLDVVESKLKKVGRELGDTAIQEESEDEAESLDVDVDADVDHDHDHTTTQDAHDPFEPPAANVSRLSMSLTFSPHAMNDLALPSSPSSTIAPNDPFADGFMRASIGDISEARAADRAAGAGASSSTRPEQKFRTVIAERLETVNSKPFFSQW